MVDLVCPDRIGSRALGYIFMYDLKYPKDMDTLDLIYEYLKEQGCQIYYITFRGVHIARIDAAGCSITLDKNIIRVHSELLPVRFDLYDPESLERLVKVIKRHYWAIKPNPGGPD